MTGLSCWLVIIAVVDLFRARRDTVSMPRRAVLSLVGAAAVLSVAASAHPRDAWGWSAWCFGALLLAGWVIGSELPQRGRGATIAYGSLVLGIVVLGLAGTRTGELAWLDQLLSQSIIDTADPARALADLSVVLLQMSTANIAVRVLLDLVGVPAQDNEKTLRGGRILGPMERLIIVGLGLTGNLTGATIVVAAKALLRFPELRTSSPERPGGASDVTEYFLIGSFASWIVAFGCVALASA